MTKISPKSSTLLFPLQAMTHGGHVDSCVNLRRTGLCGNNALTVAPQPTMQCDYPLIPLVKLPLTDEWLMHSPADAQGNVELYTCLPGNEPEWLQQVAGTPRCAIATNSGAIVMLPDGPVAVNRENDSWSTPDKRPAIPPVIITAATKGTLTATTSPVEIEMHGSGQTATPTDSSLTKLGNTLSAAYSRLSTMALSGGVWIQPVAVRYRVLDSGGNELWRSMPSIVSVDGWQCTGALTGNLVGAGSSFTVPALNLAAKAFALNVRVPKLPADNPWYSRAATIVIEATPQLHPLVADKDPRTRLSGMTGNTPQISTWLPGVQPESEANTMAHDAQIQAIISRADSVMTRIGRIETDGSEATVQLVPAASPSVADEIGTMDKAASLPDSALPDSPLQQIIASGAAFSAGCVVQNGDTTVWGNISTLSQSDGNPFPQAAATTSGAWQGAIQIFTGKSSYVTRYSGTDNCPTALNPIVIIDRPQATRVDIWVRQTASGTITQLSLPLNPAASGLCSCYISPGLKPLTLAASQLTSLPAATAPAPLPDNLQGAVIACMSAEPLRGVCAAICSQGKIKALAGAVKSQSSWDFSRCHIYAFATDGIYTVAANTRTRNLSASRIDLRGVSNAHSVAPTPHGVVAIAGNSLVICTASSAKQLALLPESVTNTLMQVAWNSESNELYLTDNQGNTLIYGNSEWHHILAPERIEQIRAAMDTIWLTGTDSSFVITRPSNCHIQWQCHLAPSPAARPVLLTIPMAASSYAGTVELRAHNGAGAEHSLPVVKFQINGEINAPISARIAAPPRQSLILRLSAQTSPDFSMLTPEISAISRPKSR